MTGTTANPTDHPDHPLAANAPRAFIIEPVRFQDLRAVAGIQRRSFRPGLAYGLSALFTLWLLPTVTFLVARDLATGRVAGCIIGDRYRGNARVMNLAIHPDFRRQGAGGTLLRALDTRIPGGDITLMVEELNTGAQALYQQEGFVQVGFARNYYGRAQHGIWMRKRRPTTPDETSQNEPDRNDRLYV